MAKSIPLEQINPSAAPISIWATLPAIASDPLASSGLEFRDAREARSIILSARQESEAINAKSEAAAAVLITEARDAAETIRQNAFAEGYNTGLAQARQEIEADLTAQFDERSQALREMVDELVSQIVAERQALWNSMENEISLFALEIARKIIKVEVTQNEVAIEHVIQDALRRVTDRSSLRILVNPDDLQHVRVCRDDFKQALDGIHNLEIHADRRVGRGGCMIESNSGSIDAKIETQIEQVERALKQ